MPDSRDIVAVVNDAGYVIGTRTSELVPKFITVPFVLKQSATNIVHTGTSAETTLLSIAVPGGIPGDQGRMEFSIDFSMTSSANSKTTKVYVAGQLVAAIARTSVASERFDFVIAPRGVIGQFKVTVRTASSTSILGNYSGDMSKPFLIEVAEILALSTETVTIEAYRLEACCSE